MEKNINFALFDEKIFEVAIDRQKIQKNLLEQKLLYLSNEHSIKKIIQIQSYIRMIQQNKFFKNKIKFQQKQKHKKHILKELLDTEIGYYDCLEILKKIKNQCKAEGLLSPDDILIIFMNVENILDFHQFFLDQIEKLNNQGLTQQILQDILKLLPGFKIYNDYCKGYDLSSQRLNELINSENPKFKMNKFYQKFKSLEKSQQLKNLDLESLLIKPCQRIGKYPLLFKDLLKQIGKFEANYDLTLKTLQQFQDHNTDNDYKMVLYDNENVLIYLQNKFQNIEIINQLKSKYLFQKKLDMITSDQQILKVICYFLSDFILVENLEDQLEYYQKINIDKKCFIQENCKIFNFKNIFYIKYDQGLVINYNKTNDQIKNLRYKQGCLIFKCQSKDERFQTIQFIQKNIQIRIIDNDKKMNFQILGVSSYDHENCIVKIKINQYNQILHLKQKSIQLIFDFIQKSDSEQKKGFSSLRVFQQLVLILNNEQLNDSKIKEKILYELGINQQLFFRQNIDNQLYTNLYKMNNYDIQNDLQTKKCTSVQKILTFLLKNRVMSKVLELSQFQNQINVYLLNGQSISINYQQNDRIIDVIQKLQLKLNIYNILDFKIHIKINKKFYQLEFDVNLDNVLQLKPKQQEKYFYFFKYIYFKIDYELYQIENKKLQLIIDQLFYQIKNQEILLSEINYLNFLAYALYIQFGSSAQFDEKIYDKLIEKVIHNIPLEIRLHFHNLNWKKQAIQNWNCIDIEIELIFKKKHPQIQEKEITQNNNNSKLSLIEEIKLKQQRISKLFQIKGQKDQQIINQIEEQKLTEKESQKINEIKIELQNQVQLQDQTPKSVSELRKQFENVKKQTIQSEKNINQEIKQKIIPLKENHQGELDCFKLNSLEIVEINQNKQEILQITFKTSELKQNIANLQIFKDLTPTINQYGFKYYYCKLNKKSKEALNLEIDFIYFGIGFDKIKILNEKKEQQIDISKEKIIYYQQEITQSIINNIQILLVDSNILKFKLDTSQGFKNIIIETDQSSEIYLNYLEYQKAQKIINKMIK